jgi:hypothetical protein
LSARCADFWSVCEVPTEPGIGFSARQEELPHPKDIVPTKSLHVRKRHPQIRRQLLDDGVAPFRVFLLLDDDAADVPVQADEFPVHRGQRPVPRVGDQSLDIGQHLRVAAGDAGLGWLSHNAFGTAHGQVLPIPLDCRG